MTNTNETQEKKGLAKKLYDGFVKKPIKNTIYTALGLATLVGTFGGNDGGLAPIYNKKSGTWGGINIGVYNEFQDNSKFYGISIGFINDTKDFLVKNEFYGVQVGVGNVTKEMNGVQVGVVNGTNEMNGVQVGAVNFAGEMDGVQVGVVNKNQKGYSVLLGFGGGK